METPVDRFDMGPVLERLADQAERVLAALPLFLVAVLVLLAAWFIGGWISHRAVLARVSRRNPFLQDLARATVRWVIVAIGMIVALEIMGATKLVGAVLGTAGVLGVALGFAFKDILENYLAGVLMSLRQPFAPRDHVVLDGNEGIIVALNARATILMTLDGNHLRLPNALVFRSVALNYTRNPKRRLQFDVGVGVNEDLRHAQHVGVAELTRVPGVINDPPPRALVRELGDWNVVVQYQAWIDQRSHDFLLVRSEAVRKVKEALERAGVQMPMPSYQIDLGRAAATEPADTPSDAPATNSPDGNATQRDATVQPPVDTRKTEDLQAQIDEDQSKGGSVDLLDPSAPRE